MSTAPFRPVLVLVAAAVMLFAAVALPAGAAAPAPAAPGGFDFAVRPYSNPGAPVRSALTIEVNAGETVTDRVEVINNGDQAKEFLLYPADAYTTEIGGGFALRLRTEDRRDAAAWTTLPVSGYTVPPHSAALVPVDVTVPADATPGDHTAAVIAEEVLPPSTLEHGAGVVQVHRVGARVYVRVAGPVHTALQVQRLTIRHREPLIPFLTGRGTSTVTVTLLNTGNTRVQLDQVDFKLTGVFGRNVGRATLKPADPKRPPGDALPDQVLPNSRVQFTRTFKGLPPFEVLNAAVTVRAEDSVLHGQVHTSRGKRFWVIPWLVVTALALALAYRRWRRRGRGLPPTPSLPLASDDPRPKVPAGLSVG